MKAIGLPGGMSWESTLGYYRAINEGVKNLLGGLHTAKIVTTALISSQSKGCNARVIETAPQKFFPRQRRIFRRRALRKIFIKQGWEAILAFEYWCQVNQTEQLSIR
jgi:hypothetical protein